MSDRIRAGPGAAIAQPDRFAGDGRAPACYGRVSPPEVMMNEEQGKVDEIILLPTCARRAACGTNPLALFILSHSQLSATAAWRSTASSSRAADWTVQP